VAGSTQLAIFIVVMLVAAIFMFRGRTETAGIARVAPASLRGFAVILLPGLAVGLLTGLVGVGGGFLIVPTLVLLARVPMKQAVGTSLLVIALNAAAGFAGYLGQVEVRWDTLLAFTAVATLGIFIGSALVRVVSPGALRRGSAVFLVVMGIFILCQNRAAFRPGPAEASGVAAVASAD
jgi:uncharacterized membrane protein YfcA